MPIYEYKCEKCGVYEVVHCMTEKYEKCVKCGGEVKKLVSAGNFRMDGHKADTHPNSPEKIHEGNEQRRKHTRAGTLEEWKKENKEKYEKDGQFSY